MQTLNFSKTGNIVTATAVGDKHFITSEYPRKFSFGYDEDGDKIFVRIESSINRILQVLLLIQDLSFEDVPCSDFDDCEEKIQDMFYGSSSSGGVGPGISKLNVRLNENLLDVNNYLLPTQNGQCCKIDDTTLGVYPGFDSVYEFIFPKLPGDLDLDDSGNIAACAALISYDDNAIAASLIGCGTWADEFWKINMQTSTQNYFTELTMTFDRDGMQ